MAMVGPKQHNTGRTMVIFAASQTKNVVRNVYTRSRRAHELVWIFWTRHAYTWTYLQADSDSVDVNS